MWVSKLASSPSRSVSCRHGRLLGALQLLRLSTTAKTTRVKVDRRLVADFLVSRLGFSPEKATKASLEVPTLKSLERPESFVGFMRSRGFSDAQIAKLVSCYPRYLGFDVDKKLVPKFRSLKEEGFSDAEIVLLVASNSRALSADVDRIVLPRMRFWQSLVGSRDSFIRLAGNGMAFLGTKVETTIAANLSLLRRYGVSEERIATVVRQHPMFITQRPQALAAIADRVEKEIGIDCKSGMFLKAVMVLTSISKEKLDATRTTMESFGWSEDDFLSAVRKAPAFLKASCLMLSRKMEFFLKEAGFKPSDVAECPVALTCSLEKRLIPRHHVLKLLKSRGLLDGPPKLSILAIYTDKLFMDMFIIPHKQVIPEVEDILCNNRNENGAAS